MRILIALVFVAACGNKKKQDEPAPSGPAPVVGDAAVATADASKLDPKAAAAQYDKACLEGNHEACRNLGVFYSEGIGVTADPAKATALFASACKAGNVAACNHTALAFAEGIGVAKDIGKAIELFTQACDGDNALACRNLGLVMRDGRGVEKDVPRAAGLLAKACDGKAPFACTNAGDLQKELAKGQRDPNAKAHYEKMIELYKKGCEADEPTACRAIGIAYLEGTGLPKTPSAGAVWLAKACDKAEPIACRVLGAMTLGGAGVQQDTDKARAMLSSACDRKDLEACRVLDTIPKPENDSADSAKPGSGQREQTPKAPM